MDELVEVFPIFQLAIQKLHIFVTKKINSTSSITSGLNKLEIAGNDPGGNYSSEVYKLAIISKLVKL